MASKYSTKYKPHPYAELFPLMTDTELEALTADIAAVGLRYSIVLYQGMVLDGRNRLAACAAAKVEPTFMEHEADDASALALVISLNVQRRDLTAGQRAMAAARALPLYEKAAAERAKAGKTPGPDRAGGRSRDGVAAQFKVGHNQVQWAKALLRDAPDLVAGVLVGLPIEAKYRELQERRAAARQREKDMARCAAYREAIEAGEMTLEEALQKAIADERDERELVANQASTRRRWYGKLREMCDWLEKYVAAFPDDDLDILGDDPPATFEIELTPGDLDAAIRQLERIRELTLGGSHARRRKSK
jgi:hypothetical protein